MCMKLRVSCAHPDGVCVDKAAIRIKFIPLIGAGLSLQDPWGLPLSSGLLSHCGQLTVQFLKEPRMHRAFRLGDGVLFILPRSLAFSDAILSEWGSGRHQSRAKWSLCSPWGPDLDPGLGRRCGAEEAQTWNRVHPPVAAGDAAQETWWGFFLSSLEGFSSSMNGTRAAPVTHFPALIDF